MIEIILYTLLLYFLQLFLPVTLKRKMTEEMFKMKSSFLARLGSGSASRSIYGPISSWGKTSHLKESSDIYAVPLKQKVHKIFDGFCNFRMVSLPVAGR